MTLLEKIIAIYPDLTIRDFYPMVGTIELRDDSDGRGAYISRWQHPTHPRPTDEQLAALEE